MPETLTLQYDDFFNFSRLPCFPPEAKNKDHRPAFHDVE
jgi:hypothetical protein